MLSKGNSVIIKFHAPFGMITTTEATLVRLRRILWRFKAKTYTYISYEDFQSQIMHFHGQKSKFQRKQKTVRETRLVGSQGYFSHFTSYSIPIELKFCRQLVTLFTTTFMFWPKPNSASNTDEHTVQEQGRLETLKLKFMHPSWNFFRQPKLAYQSFILHNIKLSFYDQPLLITCGQKNHHKNWNLT